MKIMTGIDAIDEVGGIGENVNILLLGPPGPEKQIISLKILNEVLKKGGKGIYITTDQLPEEIEKKSQNFKVDISEFTNKNIWFVDCYSWALGGAERSSRETTETTTAEIAEKNETKEIKRSDINVPGPSALNDLSLGIAESLRKAVDNPKIIFQSISTLLLYNNPEMVYRFIQIIGGRLKAANATTLFHCESGMHDEKTVITLRHLVDEVIEIKIEGGKRFLKSHTLGIDDWKEFKI